MPRPQFTVRSLLVAMLVVAVCFGSWRWLPDAVRLLVVLSCPAFIAEGLICWVQWWRTGKGTGDIR